MLKRLTTYIILLMLPMLVRAAVSIEVDCPTQVAAGEQFRLQYTINNAEVKGFRAGNMPAEIDVLMGPSTSTQRSISITNGQAVNRSSVTYTYILMAQSNGTFVIPSATATVDGKTVKSAAVKLRVSGQAAQSQQGQSRPRAGARVDRAGAQISGNDLFIRVSANKHSVYEQEPVLLTYKVYTQVELTQLEGKMPDLSGFHTQEIELPQQKTFHIENVNGRPYRCVTWSQYVMYPQMAGKLTVPSITFNGIVMQQDPTVDPFEAFFNGGSGYVEVKKAIPAPAQTIDVKPLPTRPAGFSGGVGQFTITSKLDKQTVKAGEPVTLTISISGTGNMKLIKQPEPKLPTDFEKYDPKVTDKTKLTTSGLTGTMTYDMLIVPRNMGHYTIEPMSFIYFDTATHTYKTLTTQPLQLEVTKGDGNTASFKPGSDVTDIYGIETMSGIVEASNEAFFGSVAYWSIMAAMLILFGILALILRRRMNTVGDVKRSRGANKVAVKRLKLANKLMSQGKDADFYDEVQRALWGYVADKFTMPTESLTRDAISAQLEQRTVDADVIQSLIDAIDDCEFARYAPGDKTGNMQKTYDKALMAITNIEDFIQK